MQNKTYLHLTLTSFAQFSFLKFTVKVYLEEKKKALWLSIVILIRCLLLWQEDFLSTVQSLSCVQLFAAPWSATRQAFLSIINSRNLLKPQVRRDRDAIQPSQSSVIPFSCLVLPSIRVFSKESVVHIWWPEYWRFSFSISPSNEYSGLISFGIDCFDLLAVQGSLKSILVS